MLGIISQIEHIGLLEYVDERVWRLVMNACGSCGGDLMRRVSHVLFDCLVVHVGSERLDCLSYGQYVRAASAFQRTYKQSKGNQVSAYVVSYVICIFIVYRYIVSCSLSTHI